MIGESVSHAVDQSITQGCFLEFTLALSRSSKALRRFFGGGGAPIMCAP